MQWAFERGQALAISWLLFLVAFACISARLLIRLKVFDQLNFADYLAILSLSCLLVNDLIFTSALSVFETYQDVTYFHHKPPPGYETTSATFEKLQWAIAYIYFTGLWAAKGVFLTCYGQLTQDLKKFRRAWYALVMFVVLTYVGCLIAYPLLNHPNQPRAGELRFVSIKYQFAVDFATDTLIAALPITLICRVPFPLKRKLALAGIFALSLVSTIFAVARFIVNRPWGRPAGALWIVVWSNVVLSVAVIVSSSMVLRNLVVRMRADREGSGYGLSGGQSSGRFEYQCKGERAARWPSRRRESTENLQFELLDRSTDATSPKRVSPRSVSSKYFSGMTEISAVNDERGVPMV